MQEQEPDRIKATMLKILLTVLGCLLAAFLQGKIGLSELNTIVTVFGAATYLFVGIMYLILFIVDEHRYLCNLMYSTIGIVFCIMTILWMIFAQSPCRYPEWLDFLYGWVTIWLFVVLGKKPYKIITRHYEKKRIDKLDNSD